jgi:hypothetical protein
LARYGAASTLYTIECTPSGLPLTYEALRQRASLVEEIELGPGRSDGGCCCVTVKRSGDKWPWLVVAQSYEPHGVGFEPGALFVAETHVLFLGAGERILAFCLAPLGKLWEDRVDTGFWGWEQHGDTVVALAELELAAWDATGHKLWSTFVEPPWDFTVLGDLVELDVMGAKRSFSLRDGPRSGRAPSSKLRDPALRSVACSACALQDRDAKRRARAPAAAPGRAQCTYPRGAHACADGLSLRRRASSL